MAIASDANGVGDATNGTTSQTVAITIPSGSTALFAAVTGDFADVITGCTYNGSAMTLVDKQAAAAGGRFQYLFYTASPTSGTHNVVASASGSVYIGVAAASYSGSSVTSQPEATNKGTGTTPMACSVTVASANAWVIAAAFNASGDIAAGSSTTLRASDGFGAGNGICGLLDSNAGVSTGSQSINAAGTAGNGSAFVAVSLAEGSSGTPITGTTYTNTSTTRAPVLAVGAVSVTGTTYTNTSTVRVPSLALVVHLEASFNGGAYSRIATVTSTPESLVITSPVQYQTYQRSAGVADIPIAGTLNGVSYSGTLAAQAQGQGTLTVRVEEETSVTAAVDDVGIGDIFPVGGDSRALGHGDNAQSFSHATLKATAFNQDGDWVLANDPIDTGSTGSPWPLLATQFMADQGVPIAFISHGVGSTDVYGSGSDSWADGGTEYDDLVQQVTDSGVNAVKAVLMLLGPNAIVNASTPAQADYNAAIDAMANGFADDLPGAPVTLIDLCGEVATGSPPDRRAAEDHVRQAIREAAGNNANVRLGPVLLDQDYADDVHPSTDAQQGVIAKRFWVALDRAFYGGTAHSPRPSTIILTDATHLTITYDQTLSNSNGASVSGFIVNDDGSPVTITSALVAAPNQVVITLDADIEGVPTVTWGSNDDVKGLSTIPLVTATLPDASTVSLVPEPLLDNGVTLSLTGTTYTNTATVRAPSVAAGAVTLTIPTIASGVLLFRPRLSGDGVTVAVSGGRSRDRSRAR